MNELFDIRYWLTHIDELNQLNLKDIIFITVFYAGQIVVALFAARSIVTYFCRKCGLYHPNHYR